MSNHQVFLGGTCGVNNWREGFIKSLVKRGVPEDFVFNPVLPPGAWNAEAQKKEDEVKEQAGVLLFYLGSPGTSEFLPYSTYSLVQLVDSCFNVNRTTRACINPAHMSPSTVKSFRKALKDLEAVVPGLQCADWGSFVGEAARLWSQSKTMLAFLGGTSGNNPWRTRFVSDLRARGVNTERFFNPQVPAGTWNPGVQFLEDQMRVASDHEFFYLASPEEMRTDSGKFSAYSVVEAYIALYQDSNRVCICFDFAEIEGHSLQSMQKFQEDAIKRFPDAAIHSNLEEVADMIAVKFFTR